MVKFYYGRLNKKMLFVFSKSLIFSRDHVLVTILRVVIISLKQAISTFNLPQKTRRWKNISPLQKQPPEVFYEKGVLRTFAKFTGKHLCKSLFFSPFLQAFATLLKKRLLHRYFSVNFAKFLRTPFLVNTSRGQFLPLQSQKKYL